MSQRTSYHPSGMSWREREQQKERDRKEAEARAKEEERLRGVRPTEENFPSLGGVVAKPKPVTQTGMFAKLASAWQEHDEVEKNREQSRKEQEERERQQYTYHPRRMHRRSWYAQEESDEPDEEEESHTPKYGNPLEDEWKTVDYKHGAPKTTSRRYVNDGGHNEDNEEYNAELYDIGSRTY
jgi:hypothetical protein